MRSDDSPITYGDLKKVIKFVKGLDARLGDAFEKIEEVDDKQAGFWDEHEQKIARHQRAITRLTARIDDLEDDEVDDEAERALFLGTNSSS